MTADDFQAYLDLVTIALHRCEGIMDDEDETDMLTLRDQYRAARDAYAGWLVLLSSTLGSDMPSPEDGERVELQIKRAVAVRSLVEHRMQAEGIDAYNYEQLRGAVQIMRSVEEGLAPVQAFIDAYDKGEME